MKQHVVLWTHTRRHTPEQNNSYSQPAEMLIFHIYEHINKHRENVDV